MNIVEAKRLPLVESLGDNTLRVDLPASSKQYAKVTLIAGAEYDPSTGAVISPPGVLELWLNFDQVVLLSDTLISAQERWPK
jgi:hypothetical protein